jgi:hypothetical protein
MCFIKIIKNNNIKPLIAKNDITVYKYTSEFTENSPYEASNSIFKSLVKGYDYHRDKENPTIELKPRFNPVSSFMVIEKGYHSYGNLKLTKKYYSRCYREGHRVYKTYFGKFIIPKGSKYYVSIQKYYGRKYVSSNIIYKGLV